MNTLLKPRLFLMGFLPGFTFMIGVFIIYKNYKFHEILELVKGISFVLGVAIIVLSFIVGQIFDSFRDYCLEKLFEKTYKKKNKKDINWNFFYESSDKKIDRLDNNYFIFYVLNINIAISLSVLTIFVIINSFGNEIFKKLIVNPIFLIIAFTLSITILYCDAQLLRRHISRHTNLEKKK